MLLNIKGFFSFLFIEARKCILYNAHSQGICNEIKALSTHAPPPFQHTKNSIFFSSVCLYLIMKALAIKGSA